ncbi:hypothetical protein BDZ94DRAFT_466688 [Collybia nuda]|uniref:Autophagy-related protein 2 n=1 Tax=Collybia nuda TaxID=64659 RepID=A0A9P5YBR4_9AGAR|nr:hypothetical protein BDZ94DRAFT_466688 [Collybia nuda]
MTSWYSWLPGLPSLNLALPSKLQGRFLSFILKKSLGHLLRPGQLDTRQIDSQIGSGYVQVNDVELDNEAINDLIYGLPITLHDGFMSSITARVPWPNPLTSTLGFSLNSLRLTFHLLPPSCEFGSNHPDVTLAESVLSVAESFVHEELTPQEEKLWNSTPDLSASVHPDHNPNIPGGLDVDPFLSAPEEMLQPESNPPGVSLFTTLIERLLARFEFDAVNTEITLVHPGNISITLTIAEIRYQTEGHGGSSDERYYEIGTREGETRTLSMSGIKITALNLKKNLPGTLFSASLTPSTSEVQTTYPSHYDLHPPEDNSRGASPTSSTSSMDEETRFAMSQSLAFLPPRPVSPAASDTSSMYQSAMSATRTLSGGLNNDSTSNESRTPSPVPVIPIKTKHTNDQYQTSHHVTVGEEILTFGAPPVLIKLTTDSVDGTEAEGPSPASVGTSKQGRVHLSITCGVIGCALRGWQIAGLTELAIRWTSHISPKGETGTSIEPQSTAGYGVTVAVHIRGLVCLIVFPPHVARVVPGLVHNMSLTDFFKRPLVPPTLPQGYLRIHLDNMSGSLLPGSTNAFSTALFVHDFSVFSFNIPTQTDHHRTPYISPVIIFDHALSSQYSNIHIHPYQTRNNEIYTPLPKFDTLDWTDPKYRDTGAKPSSWRIAPPTKSSRGQKPPSELDSDSNSPLNVQHPARVDERPRAISININKQSSLSHRHLQKASGGIEIVMGPLHTFMDFGLLLDRDGILALIDEVLIMIKEIPEGDDHRSRCSGCARTLYTQDRNSPDVKERCIPESLVLEDLDRSDQYNNKSTSKAKESTPNTGPKVSLRLDLLRIEIRCPPSPGHPVRSGALCIDLHDIELATRPILPKPSAHFANINPSSQEFRMPGSRTLISIEFSRVLIASAAVHEHIATSIISIGSLGLPSQGTGVKFGPVVEPSVALKPRITLNSSKANPQQDLSFIDVDVPSIHIDINKHVYNALQYWVDDVAQLVGHTFGDGDEDANTEKASNKDANLIGSRFFAKSRSGSGIEDTLGTNPGSLKGGASVKISVSEVFIRFLVPGSKPNLFSRSIMIMASDVDTLIELKPRGKDETTFTINVVDVNVKSTTPLGSFETFLSLTAPRSLSSAPRSMVWFSFTSLTVPETAAKESRIRVILSGFTFTILPDLSWISDLAAFMKSPPGTFDSVIPSEKTSISLKIVDGSIRGFAPRHPGVMVIHVDDLEFSTDVIGDSPNSFFQFHSVGHGVAYWKRDGFVLFAEVSVLAIDVNHNHTILPASSLVKIDRVGVKIHLCADSLAAITAFAGDFTSILGAPREDIPAKPKRRPAVVSKEPTTAHSIMNSIEDLAFQRMPEIGPAPDMINDDLPTNMDYLDESFGAAAGLRELRDDDLDEFDREDDGEGRAHLTTISGGIRIVSKVGGETIKIFRQEGIQVTEGYFDNLPPDTDSTNSSVGEKTLCLRVHHADVTLLLYEGYDWMRTRKVIEEEVKEMRRRLTKIRQLVANGQAQDPITEDTSALLFNSLYIGLDQDIDEMEPGALLAAIDNELKDDIDMASQSSWQSLKSPVIGKPRQRSTRVHGKRLIRSKGPSMEFCLSGLQAEVDQYRPNEPMVSRVLVTVNNLEILDHIKTSTWKKFLTDLRSDSHGNIRETDSNMIRVELCTIRPVPDHPSEEARLRAKILPLRLYVDQDAVDFLKKFFSFKDPRAVTISDTQGYNDDIYFQLVEVFPIDLKLDYKPRRVDYRALREGKTIELMNFFHFDGAEMTLRHITLAGITGWPRMFDLLNDLWTPDVKATQLVEVISGVAPIRSVVNVGSGIADLVLLPIAQYKKDGRIVRGVQKGTTAFVKSTAIEAIKLGARLATGTQVILEQAEGVLGGKKSITAETVQSATLADDLTHQGLEGSDDEELTDAISKYAQQPADIKEGMQSAYKSLQRNFNSAAQTILAVPMEVYERSGNEGPVRSVIRAVPIAVLRPMIGASEAVSQTLLGLHNTLDPNIRQDNEAKYKSH